MPVYISNNAIKNIPLVLQEVNEEGGGLSSPILKANQYLLGLAKNDVAYKILRKNTAGDHIARIRTALLAIDAIYDNFTLTSDINTGSYNFDDPLEIAVKDFQNWVGLPESGEVDSKTLLAIDVKLPNDGVYSADNKEFIGRTNTDVTLSFKQTETPEGYGYTIEFVTGDRIEVITQTIMKGVPISKNNETILNEGKIGIVPSTKFLRELEKNQAFSNVVKKQQEIGDGHTFFRIEASESKIMAGTLGVPANAIENEVNVTPPVLFDDDEAKIYKVQPGDNFSNIVLQNYYGTGDYAIKNPYKENSNIVILPNRTPFPVQHRSEDARFQFYLNLIYYYNSQQKGTVLNEWGMKKATGYQRYPLDHLNETNIFDNTFDSEDAATKTGLPNYYRFLKKMETLNPQSKLQFDSAGNCTSFVPDSGKNIIIPSRKFADSLYNFLNYRHDEMLVPVVIPPPVPGGDDNTSLVFKVGQALSDIIDVMTSSETYENLITQVKEDAIELYNEVADFFAKAYDFAISSLTQYWPRGAGGEFGGDVGITWGLPLKTTIAYSERIWRHMTEQTVLTIKYKKEVEIGIGIEETVGYSIGLNSGHGRSRRTFGVNAGLGVDAQTKIGTSVEYEFPIRPGETGLLCMIVTVFGGTVVNATADILRYLDVINLDPQLYINKMEMTLKQDVKGWGALELAAGPGLPQDNPAGGTPVVEDAVTQSERRSFGTIGNIASHLAGIGMSIDANLQAGVSFSLEAEYNNAPLIPSKDGRVFSKLTIESKFFAKIELNTGKLGSFFQKLFVSGAISSNPFFSQLQSILNIEVDKGIMLGVEYEFKRKGKAIDLNLDDFRLGSGVSIFSSGTKLKYVTNSPNVDKTSTLFFGTYSGDLDTLCESGTEAKIVLNLPILKQMWDQGADYAYTFDNLISVLDSFDFTKKVGYIKNSRDRKKLVVSSTRRVPDRNLTNQVVDSYNRNNGNENNNEVKLTRSILQSASLQKRDWGFYGGLALKIEVKLKISNVFNAMSFYVKKLYYKYTILQNQTQRQLFENNLKKHIILLKKAINVTLDPTLDIDQLVEKKGEDFYELYYSNGTVGINNIKGLTSYINTIIAGNSNNIDYLKTFCLVVNSYRIYDRYLNDIKPQNSMQLDYGVEQLINIFNFVSANTEFNISLEAKAGFEMGGHLSVGGDGLTATVALTGFAELNYDAELVKDGFYTDLKYNDSLKEIQDEIIDILIKVRDDNRIGAVTAFSILK